MLCLVSAFSLVPYDEAQSVPFDKGFVESDAVLDETSTRWNIQAREQDD
jgi:hypothetical protein